MNGIGMVWVFGSIALLAVLLWPVSAIYRTRTVLSRDATYQKLADRAVAAQEGSQKNLGEIREELALTRAQVASLAKVLTDVE
jgi:hypothetical protein